MKTKELLKEELKRIDKILSGIEEQNDWCPDKSRRVSPEYKTLYDRYIELCEKIDALKDND